MSQITLLDGSIGQELVHRHGKKPTPLWSSRASSIASFSVPVLDLSSCSECSRVLIVVGW